MHDLLPLNWPLFPPVGKCEQPVPSSSLPFFHHFFFYSKWGGRLTIVQRSSKATVWLTGKDEKKGLRWFGFQKERETLWNPVMGQGGISCPWKSTSRTICISCLLEQSRTKPKTGLDYWGPWYYGVQGYIVQPLQQKLKMFTAFNIKMVRRSFLNIQY